MEEENPPRRNYQITSKLPLLRKELRTSVLLGEACLYKKLKRQGNTKV